jgi:hypothetical protein
MEGVFVAASKEVYPSLPFTPRLMNPTIGFGGGSRGRGYLNMNKMDRRKQILIDLRELKKKNNALREQLKRKGISKRTYCADCGTIHAKRVGVVITVEMEKGVRSEQSMCPDCIKKSYFECEECGEYHEARHINTVVLERKYHVMLNNSESGVPKKALLRVCYDCYEMKFMSCYQCGLSLREADWIDIGDSVSRSPRQWRIDDRGHRVTTNRQFRHPLARDSEEPEAATSTRIITTPGAVLCGKCHEEQSMQCTRCGDTMFRFHGYNDREGNVICAQCHDDDRLIHAHNYRPKKFRFKASKLQNDKQRADALHYGIELEVEDMGIYDKKRGRHVHLMNREEMARRALDFMGREDVYVVHDGSLNRSPEGGIEIVSHPMTWEYYRENIERWDELLMLLREWGGQAFRPGTAGLHYHMTKKAFSTFQLYKFAGFFYKKSAQNFVTAIAQRRGHQKYARFNGKDLSGVKGIAKLKRNLSGDRYSAVNLMNDKTVELRIFKGTLEPLWFHKNMEFLQALFEYSRDATPMEMTATKFVDYVIDNASRFKCLVDYIKHNDIIAKHYPSIVMNIQKKGV